MQKHEYTAEHKKKSLYFKDFEILDINISYPKFHNKSGKKINRFYAETAKSFIKFCDKKLHKKAAEKFLMCKGGEDSENGEFKIFTADMNFDVQSYSPDTSTKNQPENKISRIFLDININGEKTRRCHIWNLNSGELIKPPKIKPPKVKKAKKVKKIKKKVKKVFDS